jgi:hypothetical protein
MSATPASAIPDDVALIQLDGSPRSSAASTIAITGAT